MGCCRRTFHGRRTLLRRGRATRVSGRRRSPPAAPGIRRTGGELRGERRKNDTHASTTTPTPAVPEGDGQPARLRLHGARPDGESLGLVVDTQVTPADGYGNATRP